MYTWRTNRPPGKVPDRPTGQSGHPSAVTLSLSLCLSFSLQRDIMGDLGRESNTPFVGALALQSSGRNRSPAPWVGAPKALLPWGLLLRRSAVFTDTGITATANLCHETDVSTTASIRSTKLVSLSTHCTLGQCCSLLPNTRNACLCFQKVVGQKQSKITVLLTCLDDY